MSVCVCVCVCVRERERDRERESVDEVSEEGRRCTYVKQETIGVTRT